MLSDAAILAERKAGALHISPFSEEQLKGASYVLRVGNRFRRWAEGPDPVRMWSSGAAEGALAPAFEAARLRLEPGDFVLGCTLEEIGLAVRFAGEISQLSHVARFGLGVTGGAGFINPGYGCRRPSQLTLEFFNHGSRTLEIDAGMPIAHLRIMEVVGTSERANRPSIYEGADPLVAPLFYEEWSARPGTTT